jgi:hypothetical protein
MTMKTVRFTKTAFASPDGVRIVQYQEGWEGPLPDSVAADLEASKYLEITGDADPNKEPDPKTQIAQSPVTVNERQVVQNATQDGIQTAEAPPGTDTQRAPLRSTAGDAKGRRGASLTTLRGDENKP